MGRKVAGEKSLIKACFCHVVSVCVFRISLHFFIANFLVFAGVISSKAHCTSVDGCMDGIRATLLYSEIGRSPVGCLKFYTLQFIKLITLS